MKRRYELNRRSALRVLGLAGAAALSPSCQRALESDADLSAAPAGGRLSDDQLQAITALSELIIPQTDTPGATAAGVPHFIHQIVVDWYTTAERQIFLDGLAELDLAAARYWSAPFLTLEPLQQARILAEMEPPNEGAFESQPQPAAGAAGDTPFYLKMKELTVLGYFTSELAARTELDYEPVPGSYDGDALFDDAGRQWVR